MAKRERAVGPEFPLDGSAPGTPAIADMATERPEIERRIVLRHRVADDYQLTKLELKRLQHLFTDWFPAMVFSDLTEDTVRVDVVVRKGNLSGQSV